MSMSPVSGLPTIAVIVRTCDRPKLLARALQSIVAQTRQPDEVYLIDAGANPITKEADLAAALAASRAVVVSAPGGTRGANLNLGLAQAQAGYFAILDDDDTWEPTFLARLSARVLAGAQAGAVCRTWAVHEIAISGDLPVVKKRALFNGDLTQVCLQEMVLGNQFTINAALLRRDVWASLGGYRADLAVLEDWEFNLRYMMREALVLVPEALANYHHREGASAAAANTSREAHAQARAQLLDEWLREDLRIGRFGLGALALKAEQLAQGKWLIGKHSRVRRWRARVAGWLGAKVNG
jgi:glycosyltransferase involved in cell wall biosynthesis